MTTPFSSPFDSKLAIYADTNVSLLKHALLELPSSKTSLGKMIVPGDSSSSFAPARVYVGPPKLTAEKVD